MKVIVCSYLFERNFTFNQIILEAVHDALKAVHGDTHFHQFHRDEAADYRFLQDLFRRHKARERFLIVDMNAGQEYVYKGVNFAERRVSFFTDAPYFYLPRFDKLHRRNLISYSDRGHGEILDRLGIKQPKFFLPHFGPSPSETVPKMAARDIPILFLGRVQMPKPAGRFSSILADQTAGAVFDRAAERALDGGEDPLNAVIAACAELNINPGIDRTFLETLLTKFYSWVEYTNRIKLLRSLKGLDVHIVGPVVGAIEGVTDAGFTFHGPKTGIEAQAYLRRARVLLNSVSVFPRGSHERVWFASAEGTVLCADHTAYLEEVFGGAEAAMLYRNTDTDIAARLDALAGDIESLQKMSDTVARLYRSGHTPHHRVAAVLSELKRHHLFEPSAVRESK